MKTYEEMARDVLKRRDEELRKLEALQQTTQFDAPPETVYPASPKKRRLLPLVAVPCAAVVAIGAVTVGVRYGSSRGEGNTYQPGIAAESSESNTEQLANVTESGDCSGAPEMFRNPDPAFDPDWQLIRTLEERPEYLADHAFFNPQPFSVPVEYIPYTFKELSDYYGIDFGRLGSFHSGWEEFLTDNFGIYVYDGDDNSEIESSETVNGKKVVSTRSEITYKAHNVADSDGKKTYDIHVEAARIGVGVENVFSPFDEAVYSGVFSPDNFSVIGGYNALFYHSKDENGADRIEAIIEMGDTLVRITSEDDTDFLLFIGEYTLPFDGMMINGYWHITILDNVPDYLKDHELVENHNVMGPMTELTLTMEEFNSFYGMEADRLHRLHKDWKVVEGSCAPFVCAYIGKDLDEAYNSPITIGGRTLRLEWYYLNYDIYEGRGYLGDGVDLWIRALHCGIRDEIFSPFEAPDCDKSCISYINGRRAVIFREPDRWEERRSDCISAIIDFGDTLISMTGLDLTETEFVNILDEYTSPEYDIEITPWSEIPQDKFAEIIDSVVSNMLEQ